MKYTLIYLILVTSSCNSCENSFYGTNSHPYLNINFEKSKINGTFLQNYVDSVLNKKIVIPDSIKSLFYISNVQHDLNENQRIIYFRDNPIEWYLVGFEINPCWIEAIYSPSIRDIAIFKKQTLSEAEIKRIKKRFQFEVLDKAESYGKDNYTPDTVLYVK